MFLLPLRSSGHHLRLERTKARCLLRPHHSSSWKIVPLITASLCSWWSTFGQCRAAGSAGGQSKRWPAPPPDIGPWPGWWWTRSGEQGETRDTDGFASSGQVVHGLDTRIVLTWEKCHVICFTLVTLSQLRSWGKLLIGSSTTQRVSSPVLPRGPRKSCPSLVYRPSCGEKNHEREHMRAAQTDAEAHGFLKLPRDHKATVHLDT